MPRFQKVYLEITNRCNLSCDFCPGTSRPGRMLSPEEFSFLADRLRPYSDFLYFHVMGEPLLHPQLDVLLDLAHKKGFRVAITSNGTLFEQCAPLLLARAGAPLYKLSLSLHAYEANGRYLPGEDLTARLAAVRALGEAGVITVLRLWNLDGDSHSSAQNAHNQAILDVLHRAFPDPWTPNRGGPRIGSGVYLEWGQKFDWPDIERSPDYGVRGYCMGLKDHIGVLCDGTVIPCCLDGEGVLSLGNLFSEPLQTILDGHRACDIRNGFDHHQATEPLCRHCGYARRFLRQ